MNEEELRIGVFVCHCGSNIAGVVDVEEVAEYARTLPGVAFVTRNLYTCAEDGLSAIKETIREKDLNRVIVASCTPRTHEPLFKSTCEEAGLNKYLFEMANIRDQCSWVHMKEPEKATEKAKDLVRMSVSKARLLEPLEEAQIDVVPVGMVIGGGVAGMSAALSLADQGFETHLVEKEAELGGFVRNLSSLYQEGKKPEDVLDPMIAKINDNAKVKVHTGSTVKEVKGFIGNYDVELHSNGGDESLNVGSIVVATGAVPYVPEGLYGYDEFEAVVTLSEFEEMVKNEALPDGLNKVAFIQCVGSRGQDKSYCSRICCNVAIKAAINLAENKDNILGLEEGEESAEETAEKETSSRRRSSRRGRRSRRDRGEREAEEKKGVEVTIFNRDIMSYGIEHELNYNKAREKRVHFVRYDPDNRPAVTEEGGKLTINYWHDTLQMERTINPDLVVLATPLVNPPDAKKLAQMLKVPLGQEGFFLEAHVKLRPVDFATDGIFVCGTCKGPADITESVTQAAAAASRAATPLAKGYVLSEPIVAEVDTDLCVGCGICEALCPYSAIVVEQGPKGMKAEVIKVACKGCGACGAGCPEKAVTMLHYTDQQLIVEGLAAVREVVV